LKFGEEFNTYWKGKLNLSNKRENRGIIIVSEGLINKQSKGNYLVSSEKSNACYNVNWIEKKWNCNCPYYQKNQHNCKHIYAVNYYLNIEKIRTKIKEFKENKCPICKSTEFVIKRGKRFNRSGPVQRYFCKKCEESFSGHPAFKYMKHKVETIVSSLDLYYRGLSLRQITEHLSSTYKTKISHVTISNWIKKYVLIINKYVENLKLNTSDRWHADETVISVSGIHLRLWALLDSDTRFLIATHISEKQSIDDARQLFKKGKKGVKHLPYEIVTDGLSAYPKAIKSEFSNLQSVPLIHLQSSLTKAYNNRMERLCGTLKFRTKSLLGFYDFYNVDLFSKGFTIYYNFIRNHLSLENMTPAFSAGIVKEKLTWLDLINKAEELNSNKSE